MRLKVQNDKLNRTTQKLQARAKGLFDQCVQAETNKDTDRAAIYANEIAELRKMNRVILRSQHSLERVTIRLETVKEFGDVMGVLGPAVNIVQQIQGELTGVVPEVAGDLAKVDEMLDTLLVEAGTVTGETVDVSVHDEEARKVLQEASAQAYRMLEAARDEAERLRAASLERAGKDAERLIQEARGLLALERQEMEKAVQGLSLQLSGRILESVVEGLFTEEEKARIITRGLERIRRVSRP